MNAPHEEAAGAAFWRTVMSACQALSAELSTEALLAMAAATVRELTSARSVSVFVHDADAQLVLRARSGEACDPPQPDGERATTFPIRSEGTLRGLVDVDVPGGILADSVRAGLEAIVVQLAIGLEHAAVYDELESLVEREMVTAVEREQAIQLVLDSMAEGLLVCELSGEITPIRSKAVIDWFGDPEPATSVWSYLGGSDPVFTQQFELAFGEMASDVLPFEVNATLVPKLLRRNDAAYSFSCRQVVVEGAFAQIAITVTDVTEALAREKQARAARELPDVVGSLLRDRDGFTAMLGEAQRLLEELALETDAGGRARIIHTLKGNSSVWGFSAFAEHCHELEDRLDGHASTLREDDVCALAVAWGDSLQSVRVFFDLEHAEETALRVSQRDHGEVLERLERREDQAVISAFVRQWTRAPMRAPLDTLARQAERLAESLGKRIHVVVEAEGRMPGLAVTPLVPELLHAVRNALDHGIEAPDERIARGKEPVATLRFSATSTHDVFEVVIEDDGRGIDWSAVRARAAQVGVTCATDEAAHEALFATGLSTAQRTTAISGRGVGMAAVREAFRRLGGDVRVESTLGRGTRVVCRAPLAASLPDAA